MIQYNDDVEVCQPYEIETEEDWIESNSCKYCGDYSCDGLCSEANDNLMFQEEEEMIVGLDTRDRIY